MSRSQREKQGWGRGIVARLAFGLAVCVVGVMIACLAGCADKSDVVTLPALNEVTDKSLKDVFAEHGLKVGTCVSGYVIGQDRTADLIKSQYNSITMENAMKPDAILNQQQSQAMGEVVVEYSQEALQVLEFAKKNGFFMRGHTLVWYSQTPEWLFRQGFDEQSGFVSREEMLSRMETMIRKNFEELERLGYLDLFYAYDVVNEAWTEDGELYQNHWLEIIGEDYLWYAFSYADKYAPESIDLYYNDYNEQWKADVIAQFVETLKDEDGRSLIDGIGLQAHLFTSDDLSQYFEGLDKLAKTGLKLEITELEVSLGKYQEPLAATEENLKTQGKFYYQLIHGIFDRVDAGKLNMDAVTFWGFSDAYSWRSEYSPQLYSTELFPKRALYGVMQIEEYAGY